MVAGTYEAKMESMAALRASSTADALRASLRHVRPVRPVKFPSAEPEDEHLGQSRRHLNLCKALAEIIRAAIGLEHTLGADQFVYFDAARPKRCLAPDAFVKLGRPDSDFDSWSTWKEGAPEIAFEILSPSDTPEMWTLEEKLGRYHQLGVGELFVFDVDEPAGKRLRAWDRIENDFVERVIEDERTPCTILGLYVVVAPSVVDGCSYPASIRLARDVEGSDLLPTVEEARRAAEEGRRAAEARVAELEAEIERLRRRG